MDLQDSEASEEEVLFRPRQRERRDFRDGQRQREFRFQNPVFRRGRNGGEDYLEDHLQPARYREIRRRENLQQDFKMEVDLPNFSGKLDAEALLDWVKKCGELL